MEKPVPAPERPPWDDLLAAGAGTRQQPNSSRHALHGTIMPSISPEQLVQRVSDAGLLDARQIESLWAEMGTREVTLEALVGVLLRKELLTNYQLDRLLKGEKGGYFYGEYKVLY